MCVSLACARIHLLVVFSGSQASCLVCGSFEEVTRPDLGGGCVPGQQKQDREEQKTVVWSTFRSLSLGVIERSGAIRQTTERKVSVRVRFCRFAGVFGGVTAGRQHGRRHHKPQVPGGVGAVSTGQQGWCAAGGRLSAL